MRSNEFNEQQKIKEEKMTKEQTEASFWSSTCTTVPQKHQIEHFLKLNFPNILVNIFFHHSGDNYLNYINDNYMSFPDIIYACDLSEDTHDLRPMQALEEFYFEVKNINQDVEIASLSLNHTDTENKLQLNHDGV